MKKPIGDNYTPKMQTVIRKFNGLSLEEKKYIVYIMKGWEKVQTENEIESNKEMTFNKTLGAARNRTPEQQTKQLINTIFGEDKSNG